MFIRDLSERKEIVSGDGAALRELFNPLKDDLKVGYSLAHAVVRPGKITAPHRLKVSEVYYVLAGEGIMYVDYEEAEVREGQAVYIPPRSTQKIRNVGEEDLVFLCIVEPAWRPECEEVLGGKKVYSRSRKDGALTRGKILGYLKGNPGACRNEIREALGLHHTSMAHNLKRLENEGDVISEVDGKEVRYWVAEEK